MKVKIALAGNPNSGKTTLFNALTGSNQFVGNWPGVTVEKKRRKNQRIYDKRRRSHSCRSSGRLFLVSLYTGGSGIEKFSDQ